MDGTAKKERNRGGEREDGKESMFADAGIQQ
jgi:hypothetical protein